MVTMSPTATNQPPANGCEAIEGPCVGHQSLSRDAGDVECLRTFTDRSVFCRSDRSTLGGLGAGHFLGLEA